MFLSGLSWKALNNVNIEICCEETHRKLIRSIQVHNGDTFKTMIHTSDLGSNTQLINVGLRFFPVL